MAGDREHACSGPDQCRAIGQHCRVLLIEDQSNIMPFEEFSYDIR